MSLLILALICLFIGLPIGLSFILRTTLSRQTEDPALALHEQRLESLKQEHRAGLVDRQNYDAARLETERSIIDHISTPPESLTGASRAHWVIGISTLLLIPLLALLLYAINGQPFLGAHPAPAIPAGAFRTSPLTPPAGTPASTMTTTPNTAGPAPAPAPAQGGK